MRQIDRLSVLTFLCVLQPLDKFLHLLEEDAPPFGEVAVRVPLQYGLLTQDVRCGATGRKCRRGRQKSANLTCCLLPAAKEEKDLLDVEETPALLDFLQVELGGLKHS